MGARGLAAAVVGCVVLLQPGVALAHAELDRADPAAGVTLAAPPTQVRLTFTEALSADSRLTVTDGCGTDVTGTSRADGDLLTADLGAGSAGAWQVAVDVVSGDDGHETQDSWSFTVSGSADCSAQTAPPTAGRKAAAPSTSSSGASSTVVVVLAGVTLVAVVLGLAVRRRST